MRIFKWTASLSLACVLAATAAFAQTSNTGNNPGQTQEPPANGATRVESPIQNSTLRTWADSTRSRSQTTGSDSTSGSRTTRPADGRNGAANTQVTFPSCQDSAAANFGSLGNCIYIPIVQPPATCQDPSATNFGGALPCRYAPTTCQDPAATNFGGSLPCQYPVRCTDPAATNFNQIGACVYGCVGPSSENRTTSGIACPAPTTGTYSVVTQWNRTCNNGVWSSFAQGAQISSTQAADCRTPPTTCQDPSASNFGGPLPCTYAPPDACTSRPGTADCCLANPSHSSCGRFNCEANGGQWSLGTCRYGVCGMWPEWPCSSGETDQWGYPCYAIGASNGGYACSCDPNAFNRPGVYCP